MSDDFIPLNQSTPVQRKWQNTKRNMRYHDTPNQQSGNQRGGFNKWGKQRNSSHGSFLSQKSESEANGSNKQDNFSSDKKNEDGRNAGNKCGYKSQQNSGYGNLSSSYRQENISIDAYIHHTMLYDPWLRLRQSMN